MVTVPKRKVPHSKQDQQSTHSQKSSAKKRADRSAVARSKISNGSALLPDVDGRSLWARRARDLVAALGEDQGGEIALSEARRALIKRAAVLIVEIEILESKMASKGDGASPKALMLHQRMTNTLRRTLEAIGLDRKARDVTPTLEQYSRQREVSA